MPPSDELNERTYRLRREEVERLIKERGLTPARLAPRLDVHVKTVRRWLKGGTLYVSNAVALAEILGARAQDLIEGYQPHVAESSLGSNVSLNVQCATPDEFRYLCFLLSEVGEKLNAYRQTKLLGEITYTVYFLTGEETTTNRSVFYFAIIDKRLVGKMNDGIAKGFIPEFAVVVERGYGNPTPEVLARMKKDYGYIQENVTYTDLENR